QYERAKQLLTERKDELEILAKALLEKEVLLKSDVERLIGERPKGDDGTNTIHPINNGVQDMEEDATV
ncbi:MAG: hypothetical protein AAFO07_09580, partial [Bacteroidota bacterium]